MESSTFNARLNGNVHWRVDMNAMSKQSSEINEAIAHFEMNFQKQKNNNNNNNNNNEETVKFEMNREEINQMLNHFNQIQACYSQLMSSNTSNTNKPSNN
jgi:multidrug efflux pump subunit AcrB